MPNQSIPVQPTVENTASADIIDSAENKTIDSTSAFAAEPISNTLPENNTEEMWSESEVTEQEEPEFNSDSTETAEPATQTEMDSENFEDSAEMEKEIDFFETEEETPKPAPRIIKKAPAKTLPIPAVRDPLTLRIEQIMEDNLGDVYKELTPIQQQEFRMQGETTARKIRTLMKQTKVKMREIFKLIYDWLKMLPGINHFFLEQEAKIKADKILGLKNQNSLEL